MNNIHADKGNLPFWMALNVFIKDTLTLFLF